MKAIHSQPIEILLAEDNDDDIVLIQESFARTQLTNTLHVVRDGEEAMAYLRREGKYTDAASPGLMLLDINMPKKNSFEMLEEMVSVQLSAIVRLSAHAEVSRALSLSMQQAEI